VSTQKKFAFAILSFAFLFLAGAVATSIFTVLRGPLERQDLLAFWRVKSLKRLAPSAVGGFALLKGEEFARRGEWGKVQEMYEEALEVVPNDPTLLNNLGYLLFEQGQVGRAEQLLRRAVEVSSQCAECLNNLGRVHFSKNETTKAAGYFYRAAKLDPHLPDARLNLAVLSESKSDFSNALFWYQEALSTLTDKGLREGVESRISWMSEVVSDYQRDLTSQKK
jgi:tetratricopeptide (TPR) repeat protein